MTEHVHRWYLYGVGHSPDANLRAVCLECKEQMTVWDIEARLNATERLSAEDAQHLLSMWQAYIAPKMSGWDTSAANLGAYANILEGKDE